MKTPRILTIYSTILLALASSASAEIIGVEQFDYPDGAIATKNGGTFWDYKNTAPVGHGGTPTAWGNFSGAPVVAAGRLVTNNNSALRKYHPNEPDGSVGSTTVERIVYHRATFTTGATLPDFVGLSSYFFTTEQVFFGKPFAGANFAFIKGPDTVSTSIAVQPNTTYTLVTKLDYVTRTIRLFINPDLTAPEPVTADASFTFGAAFNPSTAVRLASGFSGSAVTWDDLSVATAWSDFTTVVTTPADEDDGSLNPMVGSGTSLREAVKYSPARSLITFDSALNGKTCTLSLGEMVIDKPLTIDASALASGVTIDANRTSRHFFIAGSTASLTLKALSLINGNGGGNGGNVGGAIHLFTGNLFLQRCTLSGNFAESGGAIWQQGSGSSRLEECTLTGNRATGSIGGAGILVFSGTCNLSRCTLSGNAATRGGGGLFLQSPASVSLSNCLIAGNTDSIANDIYKSSGTLTASGSNLIGSNATVESIFSGPLVGTQATPRDPKLSPLGYFGGPTQTMHPLIGSPAIDAGGTTDPGGTDQRGFPRFVDGDGSGTAQLDIGAVECWPRARSLFFTDHPVTTAADEDDGSILSGFGTGTSLREVVKYAPNSTPGGFIITFSPALAGQTITLGGTEIPLNNNLFIDASNLSSPVTISGNNASRVFNIPAGASVAMHHLVITNGRSADGVIGPGGTHGADGGGILNAGSLGLFFCTISNNRSGDGGIITGFSLGTPGGSGGAIDSSGPVSLTACTLSGNSTGSGLLVSSTAASGGSGGAIFSSAPLSLTACTLSSNATGRGGQGGNEGGDGGNGGAIFAGHSLSLTACTLSGNTTGNGGQGDNGGGRGGGGGGIFSIGPLILNTCTLFGNATGSGGFSSQSSTGEIGGNGGSGGGIRKNDSIPYRLIASTLAANRTGQGGGGTAGPGNFGLGGGISGGNAILKHCLIAQNIGASGAADDASVSTLAYLQANLVRTSSSSSTTGPAPLTGDPLLAPLSDYGGPTFTLLPLPGSPAINAATGSTAITDQRGLPMNGTPDLGAVEFQAALAGFVDTDSDGMDDRLEVQYGFIVGVNDGNLDADGDGSSNKDELGNKTGPRDPASLLKMLSISKSGNNLTFTWTSFPGLGYTAQFGNTLSFGGNVFVGTATGMTTTQTIGPVTGNPIFLRIRRD